MASLTSHTLNGVLRSFKFSILQRAGTFFFSKRCNFLFFSINCDRDCGRMHCLIGVCISDVPAFSAAVHFKVSKGAKIRNRYNQVPHLTQDTNGKVTDSQLDTTNESQEVSPFPAGDHKAHINRRVQRHSKHMKEQKHKISTKEVPPWNCQ